MKTSRNIANAGKLSQEYSKMIKNENSRNKTEGSRQDEKMVYWILAVKNDFGAEEFFKHGKEKLLEKKLEKYILRNNS